MLWPLETENWVLPLVIKQTKTTAVNHILGSVISNGMGSANYSILEEENMCRLFHFVSDCLNFVLSLFVLQQNIILLFDASYIVF